MRLVYQLFKRPAPAHLDFEFVGNQSHLDGKLIVLHGVIPVDGAWHDIDRHAGQAVVLGCRPRGLAVTHPATFILGLLGAMSDQDGAIMPSVENRLEEPL